MKSKDVKSLFSKNIPGGVINPSEPLRPPIVITGVGVGRVSKDRFIDKVSEGDALYDFIFNYPGSSNVVCMDSNHLKDIIGSKSDNLTVVKFATINILSQAGYIANHKAFSILKDKNIICIDIERLSRAPGEDIQTRYVYARAFVKGEDIIDKDISYLNRINMPVSDKKKDVLKWLNSVKTKSTKLRNMR